MNVLVACEESQRVCIVFRERGHNAFSCDILPCSGGHPEWHIMQDVVPLLDGRCSFKTMDGIEHSIDGKWNLIIAFPPCTFLSNAGARHLWKNHELNEERYENGLKGKEFFLMFYNCDCPKIAIENPTPSKIFDMPPPTQTIQPYQFGDPYSKRTNLWLKGLPKLTSTKIVEPVGTWCPSGSYSHKHAEKHKGVFTKDRARNRSKTFPGIARAMGTQWSDVIAETSAPAQGA